MQSTFFSLAIVGAVLVAAAAILGLVVSVLRLRKGVADDYATKDALNASSADLGRRIAESNERAAQDRAEFHHAIASLRQESLKTDAEIFGELRKISASVSNSASHTERTLGRIEGTLDNLPCAIASAGKKGGCPV